MEKIEKAARAALVLCILFLIAAVVLFFVCRRSYDTGSWWTLLSGIVEAVPSFVCLSQALVWGFLRYVLHAWLQKEHWS